MKIPVAQQLVKSIALLGIFAVSAVGQVQVHARAGFDVPPDEVNRLFNITFRVVAEEFHLGDGSEIRVPVTLVLGEPRDGVVGDETTRVFTIYMSRWNETMFATSVSRIALQHLLSQDRKARIVRESLRRAHIIAPVALEVLALDHKQLSPERAALPQPLSNRAVPCRSSSRSPFPAESEGEAIAGPDSFCSPADQLAP